MSILVTAEQLQALLASGDRVVVLDVRWKLGGPPGKPLYLAGHIPTAVYVDLDTELARHGEKDEGRHPVPLIDDLQRAARSWGIDPGDTVVVYDDLSNLSSARGWWLLRNAGITDVRLLDGALGAWIAAGYELETGDVRPTPGSVTLEYGSLPTLDGDGAAALASTGVLLDARAPERFRGEVEPMDPRAGHIPGARNAPAAANVDASGRFLPADELRARFEALGVRDDRPVGVYCGSGVTAAADAVALTLAGFAPALYPGSWSAWSNTPGRPVATGA
ncbi:sulfurtransferase [Subtercola boreus]|uniref:Sulfurtransferase n=1 Tax=Subtercola boreus TaxID=120213 RepID=A0A3E0WGL3_9MICO|nr:sulfurtransferase [Subtercola boreus]RFA23392.1 sulfurtransferase [Subtercola boreus]RFA23785.1 sulfurtransferase [Subtercola boreus]RFA29486.1 sulfurtransferase [Subtercola boreus]